MKASDLFVKALENEGLTHIFAVPGEENLDLIESLRKSTIKLIVTRHEQSAGFMAATFGRLTGKTGVCLSTLGPGATNLVTAAAYAQLGGMPMLMITGQKPIHEGKQGRFQIVDIVEMMKPLTKFTKQIVHSQKIPALVRESFRLAEEERPGAVHLELPEDIAQENHKGHVFEVHEAQRPMAEESSILEAVKMLESAKSPLLLIGAGANRKRTSAALQKFVDATSIPFFNTQMGKGVIDERHPLFMGTAALSEGDFLHCAINYADLIINVGHDTVEKPPFLMHQNKAKVIHVNFFSAHIDEVYFPQLELIGDIASTVELLSYKLTRSPDWDFNYYKDVKAGLEKNIIEHDEDITFPMLPQRLVSEVRKVMPDDGILALDNGMYKIWFARNYKAYGPNTILLDNALATMGAGLPSSMAAKMVNPDKTVVAICGDGGFMMTAFELETAVRLGLSLIVVVICDKGYGMIKWKQTGFGFKEFGLDFENPDFIQFAGSFGATGHEIDSIESFRSVFVSAQTVGGVHVIAVPIDYSQNHKALTEELQQHMCLFEPQQP